MGYKVFIDNINGEYEKRIEEAFKWLQLGAILKKGARVFIKPNLTYPRFKPGVTTTPQMLEALIRVLKDYDCKIMVGESDGGYNAFEAKDVFHAFGLYDCEKKYGIKVVNLSKLPYEYIAIRKFGKEFKVEIPKLLKYETDAFITLPVPKVHCMTGISLSYKNQWGCVPNVMRLRYHSVFDQAIFAINNEIKNKITIIDGTYGLTRNGPMMGDVLDLRWMIVSNSFEAADLIASRIMKVDLKKIRHYRLAFKNGMVPKKSEILLNQDYKKFISDKFYLKRDFWNYVALAAFNNPYITHFFYESMFANLLHKIMYTFRKKTVSDE